MTCPSCMRAGVGMVLCHDCIRRKAKLEEREDIVAWLRGGVIGLWSTEVMRKAIAIAIERGEHTKENR